ncbi:MAG: glycosyltransferase family 2 protein [Chitinophagaceae bacterium]
MKHPFSVVIICRNEADVIGATLSSLEGLTDDVVVYDNGSTDDTIGVIQQFPVRLFRGSWEGFGKTKTKAIAEARHDWILGLDADEAVDEELKQNLATWQPPNDDTVYEIAFKNYLGDTHLRFGEWGRDFHIRLFNRTRVHWDEAPVHENLVMPSGIEIKRLKGHILHRTMKDLEDYRKKMKYYAGLGAEKYFRQGKKAGWIKRRLSPVFTFFHYYILKLGFLDGRKGFLSARMTAWYTAMKYAKLKEMHRQKASNS